MREESSVNRDRGIIMTKLRNFQIRFVTLMIAICLVQLLNTQTIYSQTVSSAPTVLLSSTVRMLLAQGPVNNNNNRDVDTRHHRVRTKPRLVL